MTKKSVQKIFVISLALIITTYFTRRHTVVPFLGAGICLVAFAILTICTLIAKRKMVGDEYISAKEVSAFKMFDAMQMFAKIAFYISVMCFFNAVLMDGEKSFLATINYLLLFFVLIAFALVAVYMGFAKKVASHFDCINVFIFGSFVWLFASVLTYCKVFYFTASGYVFCVVGIGIVYASLVQMRQSVCKAMEILDEMQDKRFAKFVSYNDTKALFLAEMVLLAVMIVFSDPNYATQTFSDALLLLPGVFLFVACVFACLQPLDKKNAEKMVVYRTSKGEEKEKEIIRNSLARKLVKTKNKVGIRVMTWFVRPFFPSRCVGKNKIKLNDGPVVFVANHYEIYGPVIAVLRMPTSFRPWVINQMLDDKLIEEQMVGGIDKIRFLPKCIKKRLPKIVKGFMKYILTAMEPIPVYRGNLREVITTINLTVEAMQEGDNIMLFPENPDKAYDVSGGVDKFYSGFAEIGSSYFKKTGKCTTFYPVYISKKKKKIFIGDGIKFDSTMPKAEEKRRIASELHGSMQRMAQDSVKKED